MYNDGVSDKSGKAIDVSSEFDFDEITFFDGGRLLWHWRVIAADFVDGNTSGESDSLEDLLLVVHFGEFFQKEVVSENADVEDLGTN